MLATPVLSQNRLQLLRAGLPGAVAALQHRRAAEIPADHIDDYVALDWFEWNGGSLRLTAVGENLLRGREHQAPAAARR